MSKLSNVVVIGPYNQGDAAGLSTADGDPAITSLGAPPTPGAIGVPLVLTGQTSTPGALTGTLTNAPATGNPQTWLQVSINGVTHWIPAWHL